MTQAVERLAAAAPNEPKEESSDGPDLRSEAAAEDPNAPTEEMRRYMRSSD